MNINRVLLVGFFFLFLQKSQIVLAQQELTSNNYTKLAVHDTLPESLWRMPFNVINHPAGRKQIRLGEYRDKLIILDFWATWCSPCIRCMPKLDSLQKEFANDVVILPVTYEDSGKVRPLFRKHGWSLSSIVGDSSLKTYFPYTGIPHQIWIRDGKFFGESSGSEYSNPINIRRALNGEDFILSHTKPPVNFDRNLPLLYNGNGGNLTHSRLRSLLSKRINVNIGGIERRESYIRAFNVPFTSLIYEMHRLDIPFPGRFNRIIWEIADSLRDDFLGTNKYKSGIYENDEAYYKWLNEYSYCYELNLDTSLNISRRELYDFMRNDINRYFRLEKGIEAVLGKRKVDCYSIIRCENTLLVSSGPSEVKGLDKDDYFILEKQSIKRLTSYVSAVLWKQSYPVIDTVPDDFSVSIKLNHKYLTVPAIKKELNKIGLDLVLKKQELDVIVVKYVDIE